MGSRISLWGSVRPSIRNAFFFRMRDKASFRLWRPPAVGDGEGKWREVMKGAGKGVTREGQWGKDMTRGVHLTAEYLALFFFVFLLFCRHYSNHPLCPLQWIENSIPFRPSAIHSVFSVPLIFSLSFFFYFSRNRSFIHAYTITEKFAQWNVLFNDGQLDFVSSLS